MEIIGTAVDGVGVCIVAAGALVAAARLWSSRARRRQLLFILIDRTWAARFSGLDF